MSSPVRGVQSIEVGARVLRVLATISEPIKLRDLARQAGVAPARAHAYLVSYRKQGLAERVSNPGRYRLGPYALRLGIARMRSFDPMHMATTALSGFVAQTGFAAMMSVWGTHGPTLVHVEEGRDQIYTNARPGSVFSISGTATGKIFAAFLQEKLIKQALKLEAAEGTRFKRVGRPTTWARLTPELEQIRERGYSTINPPVVPGVAPLAAPVFDHVGQLQLVVTLIGPSASFDTSEKSPMIPRLLGFTRRLSAKLGYEDKNGNAWSEEADPSLAVEQPSPSRRGRKRATKPM